MSQEPTNAFGQRRPATDSSKFSAISFVIKQYMAGVRTAMPVIVRAVRNAGGVEPVGTVDVEPLVSQLDGSGKIVSHGMIYDMPYLRIQGGGNAIIIDPEVGDIGLAVVADRDVTNVKATKAAAAPGSKRRNHFSDGFYFGGVMNGNPVQYIQFSSEGIALVSPTAIKLQAPNITQEATQSISSSAPTISESATQAVNLSAPAIGLDGAVTQGKGQQGGDASFGGAITADKEITGNGVKLSDHAHGGVQKGNDNTGTPVK